MKQFQIDKKGYSIREVDDYILMQDIEKDRLLKEKQSRINELREENFDLIKKLKEYKEKEESISKALLIATEKAKEIEEKAKLQYNLELKNLDNFYEKWNKFFKELLRRYPKLNDFDTASVLDCIKNDIDNLMQGTYQISLDTPYVKDDFKILLERLHKHGLNKERKTAKLVTNKQVNTETIYEGENEIEYLTEKNKVNNIKPITNLTLSKDEEDEFDSLLDKFLNTNNNVSKGYEKSLFNTKKKISKRYPSPNESGFDLEEALNPTDDLINIMKGFKLD
ncbi:MAG: DivIVA domain-containing protein [Christensenellales bacterium]